jgi:protein-S-isoprenylcysteine O-methyltransferase Ste14
MPDLLEPTRTSMSPRRRWEEFRKTKIYDLLAGLPLIFWFGYGVVKLRPALGADARDLLAAPDQPLFYLRFFALFASAMFNLLLVYMVVVRKGPIRRARGALPRFCGLAGTYLGVAILVLRPLPLSLFWQSIAALLVFAGALGSAIVLAKLGKAFSIMPEARVLVTGGPYAFARHPLYVMEFVTLAGTTIQFKEPWAVLLALGVVVFQLLRTVFEEQVLNEAYPEYAAYRKRVKRFGVI